MLSYIALMAVVIGQSGIDDTGNVPVLSEQAKKARAMAEFRANQHTIKPRLIAQYQLENERLKKRIQTVDVATSRDWFLTSVTPRFEAAGGSDFLSFLPPTTDSTHSGHKFQSSLEELKRQNFLIKGRLRDSRSLYRGSNRLYMAEYPIRYRAAWGVK
ncbi:MAG TPA: hypothetical protein VGZ22_06995 [Isosphaeraceae bacterium]|nr:hypothetical protein [Isosphaeraceae bacterium]